MVDRLPAKSDEGEVHEDQTARRQSMQQILWTFKYVKNFIQLLTGLSDRLTDCAAVRRLSATIRRKGKPLSAITAAASLSKYGSNHLQQAESDVDADAALFRLAGRTHVTQKASTFMRAFVAVVLEKYFLPFSYLSISTSTWSRSSVDKAFFGHFVEEILQLDELLFNLPRGGVKGETDYHKKDQAVSLPASVSSVISVVANRRDMFAEWLLIDHSYFVGNLDMLLSKPKSVYSFLFGYEENDEAIESGKGPQKIAYRRHRCFNGVYRCVELFATGCSRYSHLSRAQQLLVSQIILEVSLFEW